VTRISLLLLPALAALAFAGASQAANPKLTGVVGPGFTITLKDSSGKKVSKLKAGSYSLTVQDKSNIHNFHLSGPGLNKVVTSVSFKGNKTVTVTLKKGTYKYVCDPHASIMKGSFTVS
jgi:hypothetical protein